MNATKQNIVDLKCVHDFMGKPFSLTDFLIPYNSDWDWLMEVVEKIESLGYWVNRIKADVWIIDNNENIVINNTMHSDGIEAVYNACVEFVKWHNNQNN